MTIEKSRVTGGRRRGFRVLVGVAAAGTVLATSAAVGIAGNGGDGRDGREPSDAPGEPVDSDSGDDVVSDGRPGDPAKAPVGRVGRNAENGSAVEGDSLVESEAPVHNGRGGADPVSAPRAPTKNVDSGAVGDPVREYDTDSGEPPPDPPRLSRSEASGSDAADQRDQVLVDQDVPGAPTMSEPGPDDPAADTDG